MGFSSRGSRRERASTRRTESSCSADGAQAGDDRVRLAPGATGTIRLDGARYRALVAGTAGSRPVTTLGVVSSQRAIDAANRGAVGRLLVGLLVSLVVVAIIAYLEGRAIVRTIRRLVEAAHAI